MERRVFNSRTGRLIGEVGIDDMSGLTWFLSGSAFGTW